MSSRKKLYGSRRFLHDTFEIGIAMKGIDGLLEIIGGVLLYVISPSQIDRMLLALFQHEMIQDRRDIVANFLMRLAGHLSVGSQLFASFYLLSHGIVKAVIVISLWKNNLWAYPAAIVFFMAFIAYQLYRYSYSHSLWLIALTVFDTVILALTWLEYRRVKTERQEAHPI